MKEQLAKEIRSKLSGGQGYEHFSPSSLNIPIQKYIISYVASTQEMRRANKLRYKAHSGNLVGNTAQRILSKYIYDKADKREVKPEAFEKSLKKKKKKLIEQTNLKMQEMSIAE